ncbi:MAG: MgtC/SapB family protein [Patescibacteria group bacterium]
MESNLYFFMNDDTLELFLRLSLAMLLGGLLGIERTLAGKTAGMRTYALISMGASLFVIISEVVGRSLGAVSFDPLRMASQIVVGIGFIGAGMIILKEDKVMGLTTSAGLWVAAGIGTAVGFGLYALSVFATSLTLFVFLILWFMEKKLKKTGSYHNEGE